MKHLQNVLLSSLTAGLFFIRSEVKRQEAEQRQVVLVQEKKDLALQLQAVRNTEPSVSPPNLSSFFRP